MAVVALLLWLVGTIAVIAVFFRAARVRDQRGELTEGSVELVDFYADWSSRYPFTRSGKVVDLREYGARDPLEASFTVSLGRPRRVVVVRLPREVPTAVFRSYVPGVLSDLAGPGFPSLEDDRLGRIWSAWAPEGSDDACRHDPILVPAVLKMTRSELVEHLPEHVRAWASALPPDVRQHVDGLAASELGLDFFGNWVAVSGKAVTYPDPQSRLEGVARYIPTLFGANQHGPATAP